ncbi:MAG: hypothetical protein K5637_03670 [Lachnospiraceae bacterium]|nr:hypothetical protein [Lachnospiraceae bacterium]
MSMFPIIMWILMVVVAFVIYIPVAIKINKTGLKRLGATAHIFTCDPDKDPIK